MHRDYVRVHALAGDGARCAWHLQQMEQQFRATDNPWLIQQYAILRVKLAELGLIEPARGTDTRQLVGGDDAELRAITETALDLETALTFGRSRGDCGRA